MAAGGEGTDDPGRGQRDAAEDQQVAPDDVDGREPIGQRGGQQHVRARPVGRRSGEHGELAAIPLGAPPHGRAGTGRLEQDRVVGKLGRRLVRVRDEHERVVGEPLEDGDPRVEPVLEEVRNLRVLETRIAVEPTATVGTDRSRLSYVVSTSRFSSRGTIAK